MSRKHHPRRIPLGDMACTHQDSLGRGSSCSVRRVNGTGGSSLSLMTGRSSSASFAISDCGNRVCASLQQEHRLRLRTGPSNPGLMTPSRITTLNL